MVSTKFYTGIYVALFVMATAQVLVEFAGIAYWTGLALIILLSFIKAVIVVAYYQHLRFEPRSLTYLMGSALLIALFLTAAASYSIM